MLQIQGPQKLRSEEPLYARGNEEVAAQRRRWTFCVTIHAFLEARTRKWL
ncbi:MAG: hypothetical protein H6Q43_749 [Deltaproteobacteria bacterium]|nr:hypothetical protein [Deltaproteobacteria bacterium]